jgi:hypothetical protein
LFQSSPWLETLAYRRGELSAYELRILHAACGTALDAFHAANDPVDAELVADLQKMVERTRLELERLAEMS